MALPHGDIVESHPFPTDLAFPTIQVIVQMMWRCALGLYDGCHRIMSSRVRLSDPLPRVVALMWQIQTHDTQPKINNKKANQCPQKCGYYYAGLAKKTAPRKKHSSTRLNVTRAAESLKVVFLFLTSFNHQSWHQQKKKYFFLFCDCIIEQGTKGVEGKRRTCRNMQ